MEKVIILIESLTNIDTTEQESNVNCIIKINHDWVLLSLLFNEVSKNKLLVIKIVLNETEN